MEEDREVANLGPDLEKDLDLQIHVAPKQPKRRFVGRNAAGKVAMSNGQKDSIEESSAIQGVKDLISTCSR